jgi:hypothetical protein
MVLVFGVLGGFCVVDGFEGLGFEGFEWMGYLHEVHRPRVLHESSLRPPSRDNPPHLEISNNIQPTTVPQ